MDKLWQFLENSQNATAAAQQIVPGEGSGFQFQTNSTYEVINHLKFANAKSVRTSGIILASFNAVIATVLAIGIFWDCYVASRRAVSRFRSHSFLFKVIGPADIFPFVLSIAIITQGVVFAVVQSKGLAGLLILGCQPLSQLMLPATFLVPYFQFSFAIETLIRALRPGEFPRMGAWAFTASVTVAVLGLFGTYAVSLVYKAPDFCFAGLFFFVQRWAFQISIVFIVITFFLLASTVITYIRLVTGTNIGPVERQAASRMVYFMGSAVVTNGLVLPFFAFLGLGNSTDDDTRFKLAMVAMVAANLTAFINAGLWVFLRTCESGTLGRKGYLSFEKGETMESTGRKWPRPLTIPQRTNTGSTSSSLDNISAVDEIVCSPSGFTPMSRVAALARTGTSPNLSRSPNPNGSVTTLNSQPIELPAGMEYLDDEMLHYDDDDDSPILGLGIPAKPAVAKMFSYSPFPSTRPNPPGPALRPPEIVVDNRPESLGQRVPKSYWSPDSFHRLALTRDSLLPPRSIHTRQSSAASGQTVQIGMRLSDLFSMRRMRASDNVATLTERPSVPPHPLAFSSTPEDNAPVTMRPRIVHTPSQQTSTRLASMSQWLDIDKQLPPVPQSAPIVRTPPPVASSAMRAQSQLPQAIRNSPESLVPAPLVTRSSPKVPSNMSPQVPSLSTLPVISNSPMMTSSSLKMTNNLSQMPRNSPPMVSIVNSSPRAPAVNSSPMIPKSSQKMTSNLSLQVPHNMPSKPTSNHRRKTSNCSPTLPTRVASIPPPMPNLRLTMASTGEEVMLLQPTVYQPPKKTKVKKKKTKKAAAADGSTTPKRKKAKQARKSFRKSVRKTLQRQTASSQSSWI